MYSTIRSLVFPLTLWVLAPLALPAQKLVATKTTIDVGKTGYQVPVTAVFEFRNKSLRRLKIESVKPDCHCTVVDYPKGEIGMNEKFQVKMTYDARQLGHFDKQAAIISNGTKKPLYITMRGVVLADYVDLSTKYPVEMGDLRLDRAELEFDDINRGDRYVQQLYVYNNSTKVYHPNLMHLPSYLTAEVQPEALAPNRQGVINVTLDSKLLHDYGLTQTSVYLAGNPGDKVSPDHEVSVSAVLLPSFDQLTDHQRAVAPRLQLSKEQVNLVFEGRKKKADVIDITNGGQTELIISSLQMFTPGLKVSLSTSHLKPGETAKLKVTGLRDELSRVRTRPRILMITNDPQRPKVTIAIHAKN